MLGCIRSGKYSYIVALCVLTFVLVVVWSATAAAQVDSGGGPPGSDPQPLPPAPVTPTPTPGAPVPTSTPRPGGGGGLPAAPEPTPTVLSAPNRIVFHPATPVQLCRVDDGLQAYFIGRDGTALFGPWVPPFAELAATHPEGESASIFSGRNPLTGKPVVIDYLPSSHKIRVSTFYADRPPYDINKPYVYTVDDDHRITHEQW